MSLRRYVRLLLMLLLAVCLVGTSTAFAARAVAGNAATAQDGGDMPCHGNKSSPDKPPCDCCPDTGCDGAACIGIACLPSIVVIAADMPLAAPVPAPATDRPDAAVARPLRPPIA